VEAIVAGAISYLRDALDDPRFTPLSFRSGLWVMQPTAVIAEVLARHGVRVDSSVFKGGRIRDLGLDYEQALRNGGRWRFSADINTPDPRGPLWEVPIHTQLVPFWEMLGPKRLTLQKRVPKAANGAPLPRRWRDFLRFRYPRKLDFCRMTFEEMRESLKGALSRPQPGAAGPSPVVAIGHSKDLTDFEGIERFLTFLGQQGVAITTFAKLLSRELSLQS
jgi:hypothetical protein